VLVVSDDFLGLAGNGCIPFLILYKLRERFLRHLLFDGLGNDDNAIRVSDDDIARLNANPAARDRDANFSPSGFIARRLSLVT
jgi:hypothetical protein